MPFYGELGSLNPVYVTRAAAEARAQQISSDFVGSYTLGVGQFCTKPGLLFVPAGCSIASLATEAAADVTLGPMLGPRIEETFRSRVGDWTAVPGVRILTPDTASGSGPLLFATDVPTLLAHRSELLEEALSLFADDKVMAAWNLLLQLEKDVAALPDEDVKSVWFAKLEAESNVSASRAWI